MHKIKGTLELISLTELKLLCNCLLTCVYPQQDTGYNN